jgi:tripartite motif-containing protein 71
VAFGTAGSGQGQLSQPYDVQVKPSGNLLVVDRGNNRVQQFNQNGDFQATFGVKGSGTGQFNEPSGVAVAAGGVLYVTDSANKRVQRWGF